MCGAVGFQCPYLHFTKPLSTELGLAAQGLLANQGVGAGRAGMDLIFNQVVQLHHIDVAHSYWLVERFAGMPVTEHNLALNRGGKVLFGSHPVHGLLPLFPVKVAAGYPQVFEP